MLIPLCVWRIELVEIIKLFVFSFHKNKKFCYWLFISLNESENYLKMC